MPNLTQYQIAPPPTKTQYEAKIGNTAMGTTATTLTGAIGELSGKISTRILTTVQEFKNLINLSDGEQVSFKASSSAGVYITAHSSDVASGVITKIGATGIGSLDVIWTMPKAYSGYSRYTISDDSIYVNDLGGRPADERIDVFQGTYTSRGKLHYTNPCIIMLSGYNGDMTTNYYIYYLIMDYNGALQTTKLCGTGSYSPTFTLNANKTITINEWQMIYGGRIIWSTGFPI